MSTQSRRALPLFATRKVRPARCRERSGRLRTRFQLRALVRCPRNRRLLEGAPAPAAVLLAGAQERLARGVAPFSSLRRACLAKLATEVGVGVGRVRAADLHYAASRPVNPPFVRQAVRASRHGLTRSTRVLATSAVRMKAPPISDA